MIESGFAFPTSTEPTLTTGLGAVMAASDTSLLLRHGREIGKADATLDLLHLPLVQPLLLASGFGRFFGEASRDDNDAVGVGDDHVVRKDRNPTAADRLLPSGQHQARSRGRSSDRSGPNGEP